MATTKYSKSRMKPVHIVKESSGDRDLHFAYTVPDKNYSHIANYTTYWWYKVASGAWHHGPTDVNDDPHGLTLWGMSYYTAPDSAVVVRASVQAISTNDSSGKPYFEEPPSEFLYYYFDGNKPGIPDRSIPSVSIGLQSGSTSTIYATWTWGYTAQTDHFNIEWKYDTGNGIWFDGSSGTVNADVRQATYNAPSGFKRIRFRIQPVSKTFIEPYSQAGRSGQYNSMYWNGLWSNPVYFAPETYKAPTSKSKVTYLSIDLQNGTDRTLYARWQWSSALEKQTDHFEVQWRYDTGNGIWFEGGTNTIEENLRYDTYNAPNNAKRVAVRIKPVSVEYTQQYKVNATTNGTYRTSYWQGEWTAWSYYNFTEAKTPVKPSTPSVTIDGFKLTAEVDSYDANTQYIEFEVVKNDSKTVKSGQSKVVTNHAAFSCTVDAGGFYKVRARGLLPVSKTPKVTNQIRTTIGNCEAGEWSEYSSNVTTVPKTPPGFTSHTTLSTTSVSLTWAAIPAATGYTVEYTTDKMFFDSSNEPKSQSVEGVTTMVITGLDSGKTWFFRLKATNAQGSSGWGKIYSIVLGKAPSAPTTWSESSTVIVGSDAVLYWMHNSEDSSNQSNAQIEVTVGGNTQIMAPTYMSTDNTASYLSLPTKTSRTDVLSASNNNVIRTNRSVDIEVNSIETFYAGTVIQWRVRTKGIVNEWSPWSTIRTVIVYEEPSIELTLSSDPSFVYYLYTLRSFPLCINADAFPAAQTAIGWNLAVIANETYETREPNGSTRYVRAGDEIYSKYILPTSVNNLRVDLGAGDITFENGMSYTVEVTVIMNSGLSAKQSTRFAVEWALTDIEPNAEVTIDTELLSAYILPYCRDDNGDPIEDIKLSVYRREYDGRFVEIASDLDNVQGVTVTDPHPALDFARYRIVSRSETTGQIDFFDMPGVPVNETGIIIQWDEAWSDYNYVNGNRDALVDPVHTGSFLRLPYNIAVSDSYGMDVSLVEYIGRAHPVSYYGTQLGVESNWSSDIARNDSETLYALRRLAIYQGDVYVREPSGSGYWAHVNPSFDRSYDNMTIPVSLQLTRVEGGV